MKRLKIHALEPHLFSSVALERPFFSQLSSSGEMGLFWMSSGAFIVIVRLLLYFKMYYRVFGKNYDPGSYPHVCSPIGPHFKITIF